MEKKATQANLDLLTQKVSFIDEKKADNMDVQHLYTRINILEEKLNDLLANITLTKKGR